MIFNHLRELVLLGKESAVEIDVHDAVGHGPQQIHKATSLGIKQVMTMLDVITAQSQQIGKAWTSLKRSHGNNILIGLSLCINPFQQAVTALEVIIQVGSDLAIMLA